MESILDKGLQGLSEIAGNSSRSVFISIDRAIYTFFQNIMEIFFDIAQVKFLTGTIYVAIFKRIFLIIGIFMLFKLTISFLSYLISPDSMNDPKNQNNLSKLIGRVITVILFLFILIPQGDGSAGTDTFEDNINSQGILFGALQSVQDSIVNKNVLGKLVLGAGYFTGSNNSVTLSEQSAEYVTYTVFSSFYRVNGDAISIDPNSGKAICADYDNGAYIADTKEEAMKKSINNFDAAEKLVNVKCSSDEYLIDYNIFVSTLIGIVITVIVFMFTFDVAIRAIKLGILRLIAPIPAISYISPKSAHDGMFAHYTKTLLNTYLDLFMRMILMYFVILLISAICSPNTELFDLGTTTTHEATINIIIIIALLMFLVQGPKFIMNALGIKSTGAGLGVGASLLGGALAGGFAGLASGGLAGGIKGLFGGATSGVQNQWAAQNGQKPNMSALQAAKKKGAVLGSGDPNATGEGLLANAFGRIGNGMMGIDKRRVETGKKSMKNQMYKWQSNLDTAQDDFNSTGNAFGTRDDGVAWKDVANNHIAAVDAAKTSLASAQNEFAIAQSRYQRGDLDLAGLQTAQDAVTDAQTTLTNAQVAQQTDYAQYHDYLRKGAAKAESTYKKASSRYQKHGRRDDGLKMFGKNSVGRQRRKP